MAGNTDFRIGDILPVIGGRLVSGSPEQRFESFCIDSRNVADGVLFVPLMGQSRDGHQYVIDSLSKGAAGAIVRSGHHQLHEISTWVRSRLRRDEEEPVLIEVRHTLVALQKLAEWYRQQFDATVVGITGSVGKTGTKELFMQLLARRFPTVGTEKNFNNEIGVPLALGRITSETQFAVIEMAMRARGEISLLSRIARPNMVLVTSTAASHVGRLGNFDEVYKAKAEIVDGLTAEGMLVLNLRDPNVLNITVEALRRFRGNNLRLKYFDSGGAYRHSGLPPYVVPGAPEHDPAQLPSPDLWVEDMELLGLDGSSFTLCTPTGRQPVRLNMLGRGSVENFVAAVTLGLEAGLELSEIAEYSTDLLPAPQRLNVCEPRDGLILIDDSYNSSPASARDSLELLLNVNPRYRKVLVMGDMLELGKYETLLHRELSQSMLSLPLDTVYAVGPRMNAVNEVESREDIELHYIEGGAWSANGHTGSHGRSGNGEMVILEDDTAARLSAMLYEELNKDVRPTVVLIKGARGMHFERVVNDLLTRIESR